MDLSFNDAFKKVLSGELEIKSLEVQDEPNEGEPIPGSIYLHFKKKLYKVIDVAKWSEDCSKKVVVYQQLYAPFDTFYRDVEMFMSPVDRNKYPNAELPNRFNLVKGFKFISKDGDSQ